MAAVITDEDLASVHAALLSLVPGAEAAIVERLPPRLYTTAIPMAARVMEHRTDRGPMACRTATIQALAAAATWDDATLADVILDADMRSVLAWSVRSVPPLLLGRLAASPRDPPLDCSALRRFLDHGALPDARVPGVAVTYLSRLLTNPNGTSWSAVAALIEYGARLDALVVDDDRQLRPLWRSSMRETGAQRRLVSLAKARDVWYPVALRTFGCAAGLRCRAPARKFIASDGDGAVMRRVAGFLGPLIPSETMDAMRRWEADTERDMQAIMRFMWAGGAP